MNWELIEENKWAIKVNDIVIGTIYHKPINKKYSLWIPSPLIVKKVHSVATESYQYDTFEEAAQQMRVFLTERVKPWAEASIESLNHEWSNANIV